jgi:alpha-tubulin suppressor-like RCC1 family protein
LWTWGRNSSGELGIGNTTSRSSPVQVGALTNWKLVDASQGFCFAIKTDGTLWTWGGNSSGQLGLGNTTNRSSPVQVGALTTWLSISAGYSSSIAL